MTLDMRKVAETICHEHSTSLHLRSEDHVDSVTEVLENELPKLGKTVVTILALDWMNVKVTHENTYTYRFAYCSRNHMTGEQVETTLGTLEDDVANFEGILGETSSPNRLLNIVLAELLVRNIELRSEREKRLKAHTLKSSMEMAADLWNHHNAQMNRG